jgi:hypothetical protein
VKFFGKDLQEDGEHLKVPHMGWNEVQQKVDHPLWHDIPDRARFYFVHSYYIAAGKRARWSVAVTTASISPPRWPMARVCRAVPPGEEPYPWPAVAAELRAWDGRW